MFGRSVLHQPSAPTQPPKFESRDSISVEGVLPTRMIVGPPALRRIDACDSARNRRSIGLNKCDWLDVGVTEDRRSQRTAEDGTGIDV
jgi:hypothetical protein